VLLLGTQKYRQANWVDLGLLIAQNQLIGNALSKSQSVFQDKKTLLQASKFRLLNVLFLDDFFDEVIIMNRTKHKDELDKGKAGRSERLWSSILEAYNDSMNDVEFGEFAFIDDNQIAEFATQLDLSKYLKLDWVKASHWFKEMVTAYNAAMILYTKYGTHSPDFYGYCKNKASTYYYRLYIMSKPESHKSFGAVLSQELFSASSATNTRKANERAGGPRVARSVYEEEGRSYEQDRRLNDNNNGRQPQSELEA
jgi:hypothetical protein